MENTESRLSSAHYRKAPKPPLLSLRTPVGEEGATATEKKWKVVRCKGGGELTGGGAWGNGVGVCKVVGKGGHWTLAV